MDTSGPIPQTPIHSQDGQNVTLTDKQVTEENVHALSLLLAVDLCGQQGRRFRIRIDGQIALQFIDEGLARQADVDTSNSNNVLASAALGAGIYASNFITALNPAEGTNAASIVVADFNRDGKLDMAVANFGGQRSAN